MNTTIFNQIYKEQYNNILNYVSIKVRNSFEAEELTNEVFLRLNKYGFDENKGTLVKRLLTMANQVIIDSFRANSKNVNTTNIENYVGSDGNEYFQIDSCIKTDANLLGAETMKSINKAFSELSPKLKQVADLYFKEELQYKEIAEIVNIPLNSVKVMISRCRKQLTSKLESVRAF